MTPGRNPRQPAICTAPDCAARPLARGLCRMHYQRWYRQAPATARLLRIYTSQSRCAVRGCEDRPVALGLCRVHYLRKRRRLP